MRANVILRIIVPALLAGATGLPLGGNAAEPPPVPREFRGLWVATFNNAHWPSQRNLTTREQKAELIAILDKAVQLRLNVIVFQVRPSCDAMYDSKIEPWSEYLTGQMGKPPRPFYDPLAFAVEEAHKRGLELHAWFNPYRVRVRDLKTPVARNHVTVTHPNLVRTYGSYLWLDPTEPATRDYSLSVIMDVVRRYDIDGVHFDDYFYPYAEKSSNGKKMDFPDDASWRRYQRMGGKMSRADWRRENVNLFVQEVYHAIKREKPWVKFGISPFGIWQPHYPEQILGLNSYDELYCDSLKWLADGWVDYLAPQLYWPVDQKAQSFPVLLNWWTEYNTQHRLLLAGMKVNGWKGISRAGEARETVSEILDTRRQPGASGEILWYSGKLFSQQNGVPEALRSVVYNEPALVPACPWLGGGGPARPVLTAAANRREIKLNWHEDAGNVWQWVLRIETAGRWTTEILPGAQTRAVLPLSAQAAPPEMVEVSAVTRYGAAGPAAVFNLARLPISR